MFLSLCHAYKRQSSRSQGSCITSLATMASFLAVSLQLLRKQRFLQQLLIRFLGSLASYLILLCFKCLLFVVICYYTLIFLIFSTNLSTYPQMHKKPVKMTIYINIYLYIFIMFMLCIYAHGTKSRTVHGQSIGQRNFLRV